jgi:pyridoxine kinase
MARVLAISSQVIYGPVGNTAAVPPVLMQGHEVMQIPTVILSHHPGYGKPASQTIDAERFESFFASAANAGAFDFCDAVMTGYFASADQVQIVSKYLPLIGAQLVLVDPVIGDHGSLYVAETVAASIRDHLLPLATITTPNAFELSWLSGRAPDDMQLAIAAAKHLDVPEVIATSIAVDTDKLATLLVTQTETQSHLIQRRLNVPHGTGDFLSGCYLAHRLRHDPATAFHDAMQKLERAITLSTGSRTLAVAEALAEVRTSGGASGQS